MMNTLVKTRVLEEAFAEPEKKTGLKAYLLFTVTGPLVILTACGSIDSPECLKVLRDRGFTKFIAHEVPLELARARYGGHFDAVCNDPNEADSLRILDYKSERAIKLFSFREVGAPVYYESGEDSCVFTRLTGYQSEYLRVYPK